MKGITGFIICVLLLTGCTSGPNNPLLNEDKLKQQTEEIKKRAKETPEDPQETYNTPEPKSILLVGVDNRENKRSNSDSIMIARYDPNDQSLKLASIMRDSYVKIPGYSKQYNKINHAYLLGGTKLLKETIYNNFGIVIDAEVVVDFQGFVDVIDLIAPEGIEVNVTKAMADDMKMTAGPGKQKLLAEDLLKYVRFRHDHKSDFGRVERQQEVIVLLKDEVMKQFTKFDGLVKIPKVFFEATKNLKTDLSLEEVISLTMTSVLHPVKEVKTLRIPVESSFKNKTVHHAGAVLQIDFQENIEALEQFFKKEEMVDKAG